MGRPEDVSRAIESAASAMATPMDAYRRAGVLERVEALLEERYQRLAGIIAAEAGKPIKLARLEVQRTRTTLQAAARVAREMTGDVVPLGGTAEGAGRFGFTVRVPVGVVGAITPFNFPLNLVAHKVAPAIAAGCAVVLKPADRTPLTALELERCFADAGLPAGWLNVIVAEPVAAARAMLDADEVGLVTFTGSASVGRSLQDNANGTRVSLELGNSTPAIVTPSADLDSAAVAIARSAFNFAGQACVSAQRAIVAREVRGPFMARLLRATEDIRPGDPLQEGTDVGPLISKEAHDRVIVAVQQAVGEGAQLKLGGTSLGGNVIAPTVLADVRPGAEIATREIFGPVLCEIPCESTEEAIRIANATEYGLQAAIFTDSLPEARMAAARLEFGSVIVNDSPSFRADQMPYGGVKASGNTKEGPAAAVREMTDERLVVLA